LHQLSRVLFEGGFSPCKETTIPTLTRVVFDGDEELELDDEFEMEEDVFEAFTEGTKTAEIWGV